MNLTVTLLNRPGTKTTETILSFLEEYIQDINHAGYYVEIVFTKSTSTKTPALDHGDGVLIGANAIVNFFMRIISQKYENVDKPRIDPSGDDVRDYMVTQTQKEDEDDNIMDDVMTDADIRKKASKFEAARKQHGLVNPNSQPGKSNLTKSGNANNGQKNTRPPPPAQKKQTSGGGARPPPVPTDDAFGDMLISKLGAD